jgi:thiamine biosynthesis lipoprotein
VGRLKPDAAPERYYWAVFRALRVLCLLAAASCSRAPATAPPPHLIERTHQTMGTELTVSVWTTDDARAGVAIAAVFSEFDRLDGLMSVWKAGSDIARLNAAAGKLAVPISVETGEVLRIARQVSEQTNGAFDVTFAALSGLWKFDYQDKDGTVPDRHEIAKRLPLINYRDLVLDDGAGTAMLRRKGMKVNLGGIGKGYAVDRGVDILRRSGLHHFMIQAGGDMYVSGKRGDRAWRLGIRDPRGPADRIFASLDLTDGTFSTSGDYERFFMKDGRRYHHILDLRVGEPATKCRSVTLVTERAVIADALAKGVFILGPDEGMALIERTPGVQGVIVSAKNEVSISPGLRGRLTVLAPPTDAP